LSTLKRSTVLIAACTTVATAMAIAPAAGGSVHRKRHRHHPAHRTAPRPPAQCAGADAPASSSSLAQTRSAVVCLVNQQRTRRGLPALAVAAQLDSSAQGWTNTMVLTGQFTHGPGDAFARRIAAAGYVWQTAGENIAAGFTTPRSVVAGWMASTDHCRNILDPSFRDVGTGENDSRVGPYGGGTWTQDFGLRLGRSAPSRNQGPMNACPY
jgi:uncharacterized protein YkwD